jgi:hypothetical protein
MTVILEMVDDKSIIWLSKPDEILTLLQMKLPSLCLKAKLNLPCFFLKVVYFLQIIFVY